MTGTLTLGDFLTLNRGGDIRVCVKEPGKCAAYWTTLKSGKSNMHTDNDLHRRVYSVGVTPSDDLSCGILAVYVW